MSKYISLFINISLTNSSIKLDISSLSLSIYDFYAYVLDNSSLWSTSSKGEFHVNHYPSVPTLVTPINNITLNYTTINFTSTDLDNDLVNYTIYKADKRFRSDNPDRWKSYDFEAGKCLKNATKHEFKVILNKPIDKTVKWGIRTGLINDADPVFLGYESGDFMVLKSSRTRISGAEARVTFTNPSSFPIPLDKSIIGSLVKGENIPRKQRIAIALSKARQRGVPIQEKPNRRIR